MCSKFFVNLVVFKRWLRFIAHLAISITMPVDAQPPVSLNKTVDESSAKSAATCQQCNKSIDVKCTTIAKFFVCGEQYHVGCLVNAFIANHGGALKTSFQWLAAFLHTAKFYFACNGCSSLGGNPNMEFPGQQQQHSASVFPSGDNNGNLNADLFTLREQVADITRRVDNMPIDLTRKLQQLIDMSASCSSDLCSTVNGAMAVADKPTSYAVATASGLSDVVKSTIRETIAKQRSDDKDRFAIALYSLPEGGNELKDIYSIFRALDCSTTIIKNRRIGRSLMQHASPDKSLKKGRPRPIRIEMASADEWDKICSLFQRKRKNTFNGRFANVNISPWLQSEEMERIKLLQQRCQILNSKSNNGRQYVVVSGKLMVKDSSGKLSRVSNAASAIDSTVSSTNDKTTKAMSAVISPSKLSSLPNNTAQTSLNNATLPKNVLVGSQGAPS